MAWRIDLTESASKQLSKVDKSTARRITLFLRERVATLDDPRSIGKALSGPLGTYWRYRVGDYRLICDIQDGALRILVIALGNRRDVYR
ncbi:MAG: type II toxin-antitoxin system RelE family toxin [Vulcanimicrobiaceae bacterium]